MNINNSWSETCSEFKKQCAEAREKYYKALCEPMRAQEEVLQDIILHTKKSQFGKKYDLESVKNIEDFQQKLPIKSYEKFLPWLNKCVDDGTNMLSISPIRRWLKTSGSTGDSKKIPYTEHWMQNYRVPALRVLFANYIEQATDILDHPYALLDTQTVREEITSYLNGIPYQGITNRNPPINEFDWQPPYYDMPWFTPDVPEGYDARMYYRLRYLIGQDLRGILAINPSTLVALKHHLFKNISRLIEDVRKGELDGKKLFETDCDLANKLSNLSEESFNFKQIWPNLSLVSSWTSATASMYLSQLNNLYPGVKILPFMTCGTEGIVTLPIDDHFITGPLAINQGFYEFLPASVDLDKIISDEKPVPALLFNELKEGHEYHLIMSQANGMCRFAIGDIFKVIGFYNGVPRIEFSRRAGTYYSFTGEKITEDQMTMAIKEVYAKNSIDKGLFMCCPVFDETPYYKVMVEVETSLDDQQLAESLANEIDLALSRINIEYASKRESDRLGTFKVQLVKYGSIERYLEIKKAGSNAVQFKYKPFQTDETAFNEILAINEDVLHEPVAEPI